MNSALNSAKVQLLPGSGGINSLPIRNVPAPSSQISVPFQHLHGPHHLVFRPAMPPQDKITGIEVFSPFLLCRVANWKPEVTHCVVFTGKSSLKSCLGERTVWQHTVKCKTQIQLLFRCNFPAPETIKRFEKGDLLHAGIHVLTDTAPASKAEKTQEKTGKDGGGGRQKTRKGKEQM